MGSHTHWERQPYQYLLKVHEGWMQTVQVICRVCWRQFHDAGYSWHDKGRCSAEPTTHKKGKNRLGMWRSKEALAAVLMKWSLTSWDKWARQTVKPQHCTSREKLLTCSGTFLLEGKRSKGASRSCQELPPQSTTTIHSVVWKFKQTRGRRPVWVNKE